MSEIRSDFDAHTDRYGLVSSLETPTPTGNGIRSSSERLFDLNAAGVLNCFDLQAFEEAIDRCEVIPGLYKRNPDDPDQESVDDYVSLAATSRLGTKYSALILAYGGAKDYPLKPSALIKSGPGWLLGLLDHLAILLNLRVSYVYNNALPGAFSADAWLGRQPQLICHFMWSAGWQKNGVWMGKRPPLWRRLWWALTISTSARRDPGNQDSWALSWFLVRALPVGNCRLSDFAARKWKARFKRVHPEGMRGLEAVYLQNAVHPLSQYAEEVK